LQEELEDPGWAGSCSDNNAVKHYVLEQATTESENLGEASKASKAKQDQHW
jgi:hypothetical protein